MKGGVRPNRMCLLMEDGGREMLECGLQVERVMEKGGRGEEGDVEERLVDSCLEVRAYDDG